MFLAGILLEYPPGAEHQRDICVLSKQRKQLFQFIRAPRIVVVQIAQHIALRLGNRVVARRRNTAVLFQRQIADLRELCHFLRDLGLVRRTQAVIIHQKQFHHRNGLLQHALNGALEHLPLPVVGRDYRRNAKLCHRFTSSFIFLFCRRFCLQKGSARVFGKLQFRTRAGQPQHHKQE